MPRPLNRFEAAITNGLFSVGIDVLQVNVGLICNQACLHCHVQAGPTRREVMDWPTMEAIVRAARAARCELVDITGGAPELNRHYREFVQALRAEGFAVQVRTNLTVMLEDGFEDIPAFDKDHRVALVASMPCYLEENVDAQRGPGAHARSVEALRRLNEVGYGVDPGLTLNLVHNPTGPTLPPSQSSLEADYRRELDARFGVKFTSLITITNMPIGRYRTALRRQGRLVEYMTLLQDAHNPDTVDSVMCRRQLSVAWDGMLYDCDFNLAQGILVDHGAPKHIGEFDVASLATRRIVTGNYCFGCTAGSGSSCGGALV